MQQRRSAVKTVEAEHDGQRATLKFMDDGNIDLVLWPSAHGQAGLTAWSIGTMFSGAKGTRIRLFHRRAARS